MKYVSKFVSLGSEVEELLKDSNCLILFNEEIKDDLLMDISALHTRAEVMADMEVGDTLVIGDCEYDITAVGNIALNTFRDIGHCTVKFDGKDEVDLPGEIQVKGIIPDIKVGDKLIIK